MIAGPSPICLHIADERIRAAFARALMDAGMTLVDAPAQATALVVTATGGLAGLSADVAGAVAAFAAQHGARVAIFVAGERGVGWDALQGLTRSYAAALAPAVRVNAIAPARAEGDLHAGQAAAALLYLLKAGAVTGQTVFTGPTR